MLKGALGVRLRLFKFYGEGGAMSLSVCEKWRNCFVCKIGLLFYWREWDFLFEGFNEGANGESSDMILNQAVQAV